MVIGLQLSKGFKYIRLSDVLTASLEREHAGPKSVRRTTRDARELSRLGMQYLQMNLGVWDCSYIRNGIE